MLINVYHKDTKVTKNLFRAFLCALCAFVVSKQEHNNLVILLTPLQSEPNSWIEPGDNDIHENINH